MIDPYQVNELVYSSPCFFTCQLGITMNGVCLKLLLIGYKRTAASRALACHIIVPGRFFLIVIT
jgi:hypothetical protein